MGYHVPSLGGYYNTKYLAPMMLAKSPKQEYTRLLRRAIAVNRKLRFGYIIAHQYTLNELQSYNKYIPLSAAYNKNTRRIAMSNLCKSYVNPVDRKIKFVDRLVTYKKMRKLNIAGE